MKCYVDNPFQSPLTAISIGPGIRGIERGIERTGARLRVLSYVEIEAAICENLVVQMELGLLDPSLIWSDAKTFPAHYFRNIIDILLAGYPCQPFSNAGKRRGTEDPRHLYPYIERTIDIIRPKAVFFENVRGHVTLGLREVKQSLEDRGYRVHWGIFSAEETGASHKRERVFVMGIRKDCLDNSSGNGHESNDSVSTGWNGIKPSSQLADPNDNGERTRSRETEGTSEETEGKEQRQERNEVQWERMRAESGYCSLRQMGYTTEQRLSITRQRGIWKLQEEERERLHNRLKQPSEFIGLADSEREGLEGIEEQSTRKELTPVERGSGQGFKLGNTNNTRLQGRYSEICGECTYEWITRANGPFARVSRPGQPQHAWESPRTVITEKAARLLGGYSKKYPESFQKWQVDQVAFDEFTGTVKPSLGCTFNGYDFREDFLRAEGNSVHELTAELAWRTLLNKFYG